MRDESDIAGPRPVTATGPAPGDALVVLAAIAGELGADDLAGEARALAERVAEGRFFVACLGQFKRGKSSLLNALVGEAVLPTGIIPVTTVPTVLRHGAALRARVEVRGTGWRDIDPATLVEYVSEERNPENARGVNGVEVWLPSAVLEDGLCLVDTPGLGSVFAGNTAATREFLPHIDAALVVLGVDPPLGGEELALVEGVARQVRSLLVVLNKADRFTEAERAEAAAFAARVLAERLGRPVGPVFQVSAAERSRGTADGPLPERDWDALVQALRDLARASGRDLVSAALQRGVARLARRIDAEIVAQRAALDRPIAESEARLAALEQSIGDAAHRALQLGHLFNAEQQQLGRVFAARREAFLARVGPEAAAELDRTIDAIPACPGPTLRSRALAAARAIGRQRLEPWLQEEQRAAEAAYRDIADHFVTLANDFLAQVHRGGGEYLDRLPTRIGNEAGFRVPSRYYFHQLHPLVYGSPLRTLLDALRPSARERAVVRRDAAAYLQDLLSMNTTLVQNDLDQRVVESRQRLEAQIQGLLRGVYVAVERALDRARAAHAVGTQAVAAALAHLDALRQRVDAVAGVAGGGPPD